jgi:hypothetical protein
MNSFPWEVYYDFAAVPGFGVIEVSGVAVQEP